MESELFLLGHWKNYDEMEENLSMPELLATLEASRKKQYDTNVFLASLQGIDITESSGTDDLERVKQRAELRKRGVDPDAPGADDIVHFIGRETEDGLGFGLGYENNG